jgi:DNA-binding response OmpR family regulator
MTDKPSILLVDDESAITDNLAPFLERSGISVAVASNGDQALKLLEENIPDLIVTDILMPGIDGRELLRTLRKKENWVPIIMLTQVGEPSERIMALEEGADDYLNKPFDPHELVARIRAVIRRSQPGRPTLAASWRLCSKALILDRRARRVYREGKEISLTPKALLLLEYLMTHPDELVTRERLLDVVWGWDYPIGTRAVDTRIAELRRSLEDDASDPAYIETISGMGYRFIDEVKVIA